MVSRKPAPPIQASLTSEQMKKGIGRLERMITEIVAFDSTQLTKRWGPEQSALEATIEGALASVFGHDTVEYRRYSDATRLDHGSVSLSFSGAHYDNSHDAQKYVGEGKEAAVLILKSAIKWLRDELGDATDEMPTVTPPSSAYVLSSKVFIVHGHDEAARLNVARFIERIGFEPIILCEQANQGQTIIEKIETHSDVGFAIILMTPDDVGGQTAELLRPRARQNVLLELGYFIAHLGRKRICAFAKGDLEIPTDFAGVVWETFDDGGAWKTVLGRELRAAGYAIDWNKVMAI